MLLSLLAAFCFSSQDPRKTPGVPGGAQKGGIGFNTQDVTPKTPAKDPGAPFDSQHGNDVEPTPGGF